MQVRILFLPLLWSLHLYIIKAKPEMYIEQCIQLAVAMVFMVVGCWPYSGTQLDAYFLLLICSVNS